MADDPWNPSASSPASGAHELILLRHPQAVAPAGHCWGQTDLPLAQPMAPSLPALLAKVRRCLAPPGQAPRDLQGVWCSPLQRAQRPAQALAVALQCGCEVDARWLELNFGQWEGHAWDDIARHESDPWAEDPWHRAPPGGETQAALWARVLAASAERLGAGRRSLSHPAEHRAGMHGRADGSEKQAPAPVLTSVVVAHAGPIRALVAHALGWAPHRMHELPLAPGGLMWLRHGRDTASPWTVLALNA